MRQKINKLHKELLEIADIIDHEALTDVLIFARLKIICQDEDEIVVSAEDWERTPDNMKQAINHAIASHPLIARNE